MENYQKHNAVLSIARAIVTTSKGLSHNGINAAILHADVDEAAEVAQIANDYMAVSVEHTEANEKVRAAKLLGFDTAPYEYDAQRVADRRDSTVRRMDGVLKGWQKDYYNNWVRVGS